MTRSGREWLSAEVRPSTANSARTFGRPLAPIGMTCRHTGLVRIEMRSVQGKTMLAFDIDQRQLVLKRDRTVCVEQKAMQTLVGRIGGLARSFGIVRGKARHD